MTASPGDVAGLVLALWAVWLSGAVFVAVGRWRQARAALARPAAGETEPPTRPVVLLRPCTGHPPYMAEALRSTARLRSRAPIRIRFSVARREDPAWPLIQQVAHDLRSAGHDAAAVRLPPVGPNQKAGQVAAALETLVGKDEILMVVDADVDLSDLDLDPVLERLERTTDVAAIWLPPAEHGAVETHGDRAASALLNGSLHAFPLLAGLDPRGLVGKLFALHPRAYPALAPAQTLGWYLGEDMEMSRRLHAAGLRVRVYPQVAVSRARGRPLGAVIQRFARWFLVIRGQRPGLLLTYPLVIGATLPLLAGAATVAAFGSPWARGAAGLAAGVALGTRWLLALAARAACGSSPRPLRAVLDVVWSEAVLWLALLRALTLRHVRWAGRVLRLDRSGRLADATPDA